LWVLLSLLVHFHLPSFLFLLRDALYSCLYKALREEMEERKGIEERWKWGKVRRIAGSLEREGQEMSGLHGGLLSCTLLWAAAQLHHPHPHLFHLPHQHES
jgi:hypothetical protein